MDAFLAHQLSVARDAQTQQLTAIIELTATLSTGIAAMAHEIRLLREDAQKAKERSEQPRRARAGQRTRLPQHPR